MAIVRSTWTSTPINVLGPYTPANWSGAGQLALPVGHLFVKNDNNFAYIAMDLVGDTGNSPGVGDYFWLTFDVDGNRSITPRVDINYGTYPNLPIRIGHQFYLGPATWTGLQPGPSKAEVHQLFGPSPASATPHRIWQMRIPLSEISVTLGATPVQMPFAVRVASSTPSFVHDSPANFDTDFSHLHTLVFALGPDGYPPGTAGVTLAGVGSIPATTINAAGRATTAATYVPYVQNAAFGGVLNILGNNVTVTDLYNNHAARKYRIRHRVGTSGAWTDFRQTWANYHWVGGTYVLESFGPDASDMYPLPNPADDYSIQKLLLQWNTSGEINTVHQFEADFFTAANAPVASPAQTLTLLVDNSAPDIQILGVEHAGQPVQPCDIVDVIAHPGSTRVHIRAFDAAGNLYSYALNAFFGLNQMFTPTLASVGYPGGNWQGTADSWINAPGTFPPQSCAYEFRLTAGKRITNGYDYIGGWEFSEYITFKK